MIFSLFDKSIYITYQYKQPVNSYNARKVCRNNFIRTTDYLKIKPGYLGDVGVVNSYLLVSGGQNSDF